MARFPPRTAVGLSRARRCARSYPVVDFSRSCAVRMPDAATTSARPRNRLCMGSLYGRTNRSKVEVREQRSGDDAEGEERVGALVAGCGIDRDEEVAARQRGQRHVDLEVAAVRLRRHHRERPQLAAGPAEEPGRDDRAGRLLAKHREADEDAIGAAELTPGERHRTGAKVPQLQRIASEERRRGAEREWGLSEVRNRQRMHVLVDGDAALISYRELQLQIAGSGVE